MTIYIMNFFVKPWNVVSGKYDILRQWSAEAGRLIHIIPDAADALVHQQFCLAAPPVSYSRGGVIRKYRVSRPYNIFVDVTFRSLGKVVITDTFIIHMVTLFNLCAGVNNGD